MKTRTFSSRLPVNLSLTLGPLRRGRLDPCMRIWSRESLRSTRTPEGPATVHITVDGSSINARAWGDGSDWALEHAPALLGAGDRPDDFDPVHPAVAQLHHSNPGLRIGSSRNVIEFLVPTILEQKVTGKEARRSYMQLVKLYGEPAPGPADLHVPPAVEVLTKLPYWEWHKLGVERRRADTIRRACSYAQRL
ncbi:MAG TPA: DNA-3-methyladenine glycosylase 2 family protein, partial [Actinomycetota bacterium]|nr:DNA-3-methyladenine glycosylase 2 family protein [Actinomycetota bacterium]